MIILILYYIIDLLSTADIHQEGIFEMALAF